MTSFLQLKLDPNLDFQLNAVKSVVNLFGGMNRQSADLASEFGYEIVPNLASIQLLYDSDLLSNLRKVQDTNGIPIGERLDHLESDDGMVLEFVGNDSVRYPSFTIEMETGTGKTYVYLRTIYELNREYGFRKFIIVVPSVAIYEGVIKNFEIAESHFDALYQSPIIHLAPYEGNRVSDLRSFAASPFIEVLVMTLASFNTKGNVIYKPSEKLPGERLPIQYVQETRPILILDEPQNMGSEKSRAALRTLNPLLALRYSATHRESPNLIYRLSPFDAFYQGLVKRIKVKGITYRENFNQPFLALEKVETKRGTTPVAKVRTFVQKGDAPREQTITVRSGDDLHQKTSRPEHQDGYIVEEISAIRGEDPFIAFENGVRLSRSDSMGPVKQDLFRMQIGQTIERHMETQIRLRLRGIKVLSLFFIDRVENYQDEDGIIKLLFDEEFNQIKQRFPDFRDLEPAQVRSAYFAKQRDKNTGEEVAIDTPVDEYARRNKKIRAAEKEAFQLIMRDKERLLSFDEPISFIFAHSALKEGWDNPNVFQICTLNQTVSKLKKRQEIGRGLRICVNQDGERVFGSEINVLTVVANESYERYAEMLQSEYHEEGHTEALPKPTNADREPALRDEERYNTPEFKVFWEKLSRRARYRIEIDTEALTDLCVERLNNRRFPRPILVVQEGEFVKTNIRLRLKEVRQDEAQIHIQIQDTRGREQTGLNWYEIKDDLAKEDPRLRGFKISGIVEDADASRVIFANDEELDLYSPLEFETHEGQTVRERAELTEQEYYPVFNLLDRVVNAVGLTRKTVLTIFQRMDISRKALILKNPEGFTSVFLNTVRNTLAEHIVDRLQFQLDPDIEEYDLDELFPERREFPQHELVSSSGYGLYSHSQIDSDVEKRFVRDRLERDDNIICHFKFPPAFKIEFPKAIGNYNPDWGILRRNEDGVVLELVRETKGAEDPTRLQFPAERRKITGAKRYFREIGVDYRHVTDQTLDWYLPADKVYEREALEPAQEMAHGADIRIIPNDDPIAWDEAFKTMLPVYSLKAAAGYFGSGQAVDPEGWVQVLDAGKLSEKMFVVQVAGRSMEPKIDDGDYCVFRADVVGSREGKIVLAQYRGPEDPDTGGSYTVKRYHSEKVASEEGEWEHAKVTLWPINETFDPIEISAENAGEFRIIAELVATIDAPPIR